MNISKRERYIIIITVLALVVLLGDQVVLGPYLSRQQSDQELMNSLTLKLDAQQRLLQRENSIHQSWAAMQSQGLNSSASAAEALLIQGFQKWSEDAGLKNVAFTPARPRLRSALQQVTLQVSATGPLSSISRFFWNVQAAEIPVRVQQLQLGARKEGTDDLTVSIMLSTIYLPPKEAAPEALTAEKVVKYEE